MRILYLSWNYAPRVGGLEAVVTHVFRGLRRRGHDVRLLTTHAEGTPPEPCVRRAPRPGLAAYLVFALLGGLRAGLGRRPDVILCGSVVTALPAWLLARIFRAPYAVPVFGTDVLLPGRVAGAVVRFALARADVVLAGSAESLRLAREAGVAIPRAEVVHPGVDPERLDAAPAPEGDPFDCAGRKVLLSVGRLVRRKGVLELVEQVMPRLVHEEPDVLLLVVGGDATASLAHRERMRDRIAAAVARRELGRHVRLLGERSLAELAALYRRADVFVLPARALPGDVEGFGIVFLEAALFGTPSVGTRVGGIPEAVLDGETGLVVPPNDPQALGDALLRLLRDDALRRRLGERARERARTDLAWDAVLPRIERILRDVSGAAS